MPLPSTLASLFPDIAREAARILIPGGQIQVVLQGPSWERDPRGEKWETEQRAPLLRTWREAGFAIERQGVLLRPRAADFVDTGYTRLYSEDGAPGCYEFSARLPGLAREDADRFDGQAAERPEQGLPLVPPDWVLRARASGQL